MLTFRNEKRRPHSAHSLVKSRVPVGTPLSGGLTRSTRRWVLHVYDHPWSCMGIRNQRASYFFDTGVGRCRPISPILIAIQSYFTGARGQFLIQAPVVGVDGTKLVRSTQSSAGLK